MRRVVVPVVAFIAMSWLAGCGGSSGPKLVLIQGKITMDGQPLAMGELNLHSDDPKAGAWSGTVSQGTYTASAPVGKYKVTVMMPLMEDPVPPKVDAKFQNAATTPLSVNVVSNAAAGAYDLELK